MVNPEIIRPPILSLPPGKRDIRGKVDFIMRFVCDLFGRFVAEIQTRLGAPRWHDFSPRASAGKTGLPSGYDADGSRVPAWVILTAVSPYPRIKKCRWTPPIRKWQELP